MKRRNFTNTFIPLLFALACIYTSKAQNLLQNPNFTQGAASWTPSSTSATIATGSTAYVGQTARVVNGGSRWFQAVSVQGGQTYNLEAVTRVTGTATGLLVIKYLNSSWAPIEQEFHQFSNTSYSVESSAATAPPNAAYAEISLYHNGGFGVIFGDNFNFSEGGGGGNCTLSAIVNSVTCNNNGTPNNSNDDTFTASITVSGSGNCGSQWQSGSTTGQYGVATTMGPYPISGGNQSLVITANGLSGAVTTITAFAPSTCSNGNTGGGCANNVLQNPTFDSGTASWSGGGETTSDANSGNKAIRACQPYNPVRQTVAGQGSKDYTLEAYAKNGSNTTGVLYVKFLSSGWSVISTEFEAISSTSYTKHSINIQSPSNTAWIEVGFLKDGGSGCVFADDFCFGDGGGGGGSCSPDETPPVMSCPPNQTATTNGTTAVVNWSTPSVTDNCDTNPVQWVDIESGSAFPVGVTNVVYRTRDAAYNYTSCSFTVTVTSTNSGTGCGFDKINAQAGLSGVKASNAFNGGFLIEGREGSDYVELSIDSKGDQINFIQEGVTGNKTRTSDGRFISAEFTNNSSIQIRKTNGSGNVVVFDKNINFNSGQSSFYVDPMVARIVPVADGYLMAGLFAYQDPPNTTPKQTYFVIKADLNGNKVYQRLIPVSYSYPSYFSNFQAGPSGNFYFVINNGSSLILTKYSNAGTALWSKGILSDFPSSDFIDMHEAGDGGFIVARYDNSRGYVRKLDGATGNQLWDYGSQNFPIPNNSTIFGRPYGSLPTPDGGAIFSMRYSEAANATNVGTGFGRLSANGTLQWFQAYDVENEHKPVLLTSDGGVLWIGKKGTQNGIIKTTSNGSLTPTCTGGGGGNQPDLTVSNLNLGASSIQKGSVLSFNFDLSNIGNALANGNFTIKSYISTDQTLSGSDIQDGTIPTGYLAAGQTITQTGGALTIPNNLANGQYWILLQVDADNQIAESNENNNLTVSAGRINVTGGGGGGGADLEVSITADKTNVPQWGNVSYTITAKNNGSSTINSATIDIGVCGTGQGHGFNSSNDLVYAGAPGQPTKGSYEFATQLWTLSNLAAGQSGTLTLNLFTLGTSERRVMAWTTAQSPSDPDSQPSNSPSNQTNGNCTPQQDDEAQWIINQNQAFVQGNKTLADIPAPEVGVYPNPASRYLNLDLTDFDGKAVEMTMVDAFGRVVMQRNNMTDATEVIELDAVDNGQYILQLRVEDVRPVVVRVVVEKGM